MNTTAEATRDDALRIVAANAPIIWTADAYECVRALAVLHQDITADDVWAVIGAPPEPRALGSVLRELGRQGWLKRTDRYRNSTRPENHARPVRVWARGPRADQALDDPHAEPDTAARHIVTTLTRKYAPCPA